jgi:hypothetical protein
MAGTESPVNWKDHWAPPPAGASENQLYEWRLRNQATDAINAQTKAMNQQVEELRELQKIQREVMQLLQSQQSAMPSDRVRESLIFKTIDALKPFTGK